MPSDSLPPPSLPGGRPLDEEHSFALAADGTRLFVRSKNGAHAPSDVRAFLCDGILCDGFIWKYLWNDLAAEVSLTHWHYRGHGRSGAPRDEARIDIAAHFNARPDRPMPSTATHTRLRPAAGPAEP